MNTKDRQPSDSPANINDSQMPHGRMFPRQLLLILFGCLVAVVHGQVSYGGKPLNADADVHSGLRASVDFFVDMPPVNVDSLLEIDALPGNRVGGLRFAHTFFTDLTPENSGETFYTDNGTRIWKVGIRSSGAYSLNVLFSEFQIPDSAEVFLYNTDRSCILGAFTNKNKPDGGEFSIAPVPGDELTVEYHEPPDAAFSGRLRISEVNHDYLGLFRSGTRFNQINLPCLPDVTCNTGLDTLSRSVCLLIINGNTLCTGTMLNNTSGDGKPYLLTASHCLQNNASYGNRVVAFLNYKSPRCDKRIRGSEEFSVSGSVTRAISNEIDFALLELNDLPPADYRPYLAGWSTDTTRSDTPFTCIHHPYGEVMKYCIDEDSVRNVDWVGTSDNIAKGNHWLVRKWSIGHTWTGSSGSPLFDRNHRLRASLTGGDSGGLNGCDTLYTGDFFSRFNRAWDQFSDPAKQLKHWLAPDLTGTSGFVQVNGLDPYAKNPARRLTNIQPSDSMGIILMDSANYGAASATDSLHARYYAEHYSTSDSVLVKGIYLIAAKGIYNSLAPVSVQVLKGGSVPGAILAEATLNPNYINYTSGHFTTVSKTTFANCENYLRFETPVSAGTDFYVGYQLSYPYLSTADSFYVYAAVRNQSFNTAFYQSDSSWYPFTARYYKPVNTSLWIEPVVIKFLSSDTTNNNNDTVLSDNPVVFYTKQSSLLYVDFPKDWTQATQLAIFDLYGRLIKQTIINPPSATVSFRPQKNCLYLVRLRAINAVFSTKLLVR